MKITIKDLVFAGFISELRTEKAFKWLLRKVSNSDISILIVDLVSVPPSGKSTRKVACRSPISTAVCRSPATPQESPTVWFENR